jgi:hypothetical protein
LEIEQKNDRMLDEVYWANKIMFRNDSWYCEEIHWHRISRSSCNDFQLLLAVECQEEKQSSNWCDKQYSQWCNILELHSDSKRLCDRELHILPKATTLIYEPWANINIQSWRIDRLSK